MSDCAGDYDGIMTLKDFIAHHGGNPSEITRLAEEGRCISKVAGIDYVDAVKLDACLKKEARCKVNEGGKVSNKRR